MGGYTEALQRMGVEVIYAPFATSMAEAVQGRAAEFDLFYIARYGVAMQIAKTIRRVRPDARIVLNIHDLHFLREMREAIASQSATQMDQALRTREEELSVMRLADVVISYSEVEQAIILTHNLDATKTAACPWVVEVAETCPGFDQRQDIAFLGGFGHRPNLEAVQWFVREVMPLLRKKLPGCRLLIYGSKAPGSLKALENDDVILKGYVKTTEAVYDTARVFLAPLLTGAGLKGKVIGAFARGIPTVMTPTAAEGTGARHGLEAFIATRPAEWVEAIIRLHEDETVWNGMSEACRRLARDEYSFAKGQQKMQAALQHAGIFASTHNRALCSQYPVC
jgi:O-antigen biosynthesis protein